MGIESIANQIRDNKIGGILFVGGFEVCFSVAVGLPSFSFTVIMSILRPDYEME